MTGRPAVDRGEARTWRTTGEDETRRVGRALGEALRPDGVLLLHGELGTGKTVLARGVAEALGIDPAQVQSPTFVLMREHEGPGGRLIHVDLYRLDPEEAAATGIEEVLAGPGIKVVEWAERLPYDPAGALRLELTRTGGPQDGRLVREVRESSRP